MVTMGEAKNGGGELKLSRFAVSCGPTDCGFVEETAGFGAGAGKAKLSKSARSGMPAGKEVDCEGMGGNAACGTDEALIAGLTSELASDLETDFEIGFGEFRLALEPALRFGTPWGLDFVSALAAGAAD